MYMLNAMPSLGRSSNGRDKKQLRGGLWLHFLELWGSECYGS